MVERERGGEKERNHEDFLSKGQDSTGGLPRQSLGVYRY
jgi:hypothetical protein